MYMYVCVCVCVCVRVCVCVCVCADGLTRLPTCPSTRGRSTRRRATNPQRHSRRCVKTFACCIVHACCSMIPLCVMLVCRDCACRLRFLGRCIPLAPRTLRTVYHSSRLALALPLTLSLFLSRSRSLALALCLSLSFPLSLSMARARAHTHTHRCLMRREMAYGRAECGRKQAGARHENRMRPHLDYTNIARFFQYRKSRCLVVHQSRRVT